MHLAPQSVGLSSPSHTFAMQGEDRTLSMSNDGRPPDSADLASLKDGVLMAPSTDQTADTVLLAIKCPSLSETPSESTLLSVPSRYSILQVKSRIESSWAGKPQVQGMRMFKSGQLLADDVIVGDIVPEHDRNEPAAVHLVIRSSAWSESRPSIQRHTTTRRSARRTPSPHPAWVPAETAEMPPILPADDRIPSIPSFPLTDQAPQVPRIDRALANVIESMDPGNYNSFRSLLTWSYHRYVDMYEELWKEIYGESEQGDKPSGQRAGKIIEQLAQMMNCTAEEVVAAVTVVERDALQWTSVEEELANGEHQEEGSKTYKTITLQGLPYLLQIDRDPRSGSLNVLLSRIKRLQDIIHRMDKLISYQNLFLQASNTAALQASMRSRQSAILAAAAAAQHNGGVAPEAGPATRQHRVRLVLNMNEFLNIALPAFFLSLKVTLLVYVFTRGASKFKTCMIAGAGLLFVLFEAWKTAQRHNTVRQRAATREAERQAAADGQRQAPASTEQATPPSEDNLDSLRPRATLRQRAASPLTVNYWIESLAYVGLAAEEEEMQWHPPSNRQRTSPTVFQLAEKYLLLPMLLMIITLIPEIEQKRRKAIDEREELIRSTAKKVQDRKDRMAEKKRAEEATPMTKGEGSLEQEQQPQQQEEIPAYLQHPYCQRVIHHRRTGRQIDIAQELEAAAAVADGQQADMGFL